MASDIIGVPPQLQATPNVKAVVVANALGGSWADVVATGLPTEDPAVVGQLWNDAGAVKVSAG
jgi:hypothetical protein